MKAISSKPDLPAYLTLLRTSRSIPSMQLAFTLPRLLLDLLLVLLLVLIGRPGDRGVLASIDLRS